MHWGVQPVVHAPVFQDAPGLGNQRTVEIHGAKQTESAAIRGQYRKQHIFLNREPRKETGNLESTSHALSCNPVGWRLRDFLAKEEDFACRRLQYATDETKQSGLSCSIGAYKDPAASMLHAKTDMIQGMHSPKALRNVFHNERIQGAAPGSDDLSSGKYRLIKR